MKTIIDTATEAGQFTILLNALKIGSLKDTLRAPGPYTLFAPTDAAFGRLAPGALAALLKDVRRLKVVLTQHIVSGTLLASGIRPGGLKTVEGSSVTVSLEGSEIWVGGAKIVQPDIITSNGAMHAIDGIIGLKATSLAAVASRAVHPDPSPGSLGRAGAAPDATPPSAVAMAPNTTSAAPTILLGVQDSASIQLGSM
jgi:uncharacterized surface protein with fasciclin (FAS1) repeats